MTLRFISTEIWGDPWFEGLTAEEKMVFIYLFSNPHANQVGIAKITNKRISNETDISRDKVDAAMETLIASGKVLKEGDLVACMAFVPYQSRSGNFIQGVFKALSEMPDGTMKTAITQQALKAQATSKERERKTDATPTQPPRNQDATPKHGGRNPSTGQDSTDQDRTEQKPKTYTSDFEDFWIVYPRHTDKSRAFKSWNARLKEKAEPSAIIQAAKNYSADCQEKRTAETYIKHPATFLGPDWIEWLDRKPRELTEEEKDPYYVKPVY